METRRKVLQGLIFSLGGAAAVSAFQDARAQSPVKTDAASGFYTAEELATVTFLADAIIPRTDTPGAIDAGVPVYMDHLYLTWASGKTQAAHRADLAAIGSHLDRFGAAHATSDAKQRRLLALTDLDAAAFGQAADAGGLGGYRAVKSLIATVYYLSEPGATQELHYEPIPGHWIASAPVADIGRTWAL